MATWLRGWAVERAGQVVERRANRLLISLTLTNGTSPTGLCNHVDVGGVPMTHGLRSESFT